MSWNSEERGRLTKFTSGPMNHKMGENAHKCHWHNDHELFGKLSKEVAELGQALDELAHDPKNRELVMAVTLEAADVGNFAFMIQDAARDEAGYVTNEDLAGRKAPECGPDSAGV